MVVFGYAIMAVGAFIVVGAIFGLGYTIFAKTRTRDKLKQFFAAPFAGVIGAIIFATGSIQAGIPDPTWKTFPNPTGYVLALGAFGAFCGIISRFTGVTTATVEANEQVRLKVCPDCAEKVQAAAKVCRYCGKRFE